MRRITLGDFWVLPDRDGAFNGGLHTGNRGRTKNESGAGIYTLTTRDPGART